MSLDLRIDPFECEFPGLITEILNLPQTNPDIPSTLSASITSEGYAYLICGKILYIWPYETKDKSKATHAYKLNLPRTGLPYTIDLIQLFHKDENSLPSVLVVSPEGILRYWSIIGKPHKDKEINLQNEVVLSINSFSQEEHVNRFVLSTTTGSFQLIDIFKENYVNRREGSILIKPIQLNTSSLARRVSSVLFGSQSQKQELFKVVVPKPFNGDKGIDLIAVYQSYIDFASTEQSTIISNVDITEIILTELSTLESDQLIYKTCKVYVADVVFHKKGVLLLVGIAKRGKKHLTFALAHLTPQSVASKTANSFTVLSFSDQHGILLPTTNHPLPKIKLYSPTQNNYIVVFPHFVISMENVFTKKSDVIMDISKFSEQLLGSACINEYCQVIMKKSGICNVRHLPKGFDIAFWQKFKHEFMNNDDDMSTLHTRIKKCFSYFASKNLSEAKTYFKENLENVTNTDEFGSIIVQMVRNGLDKTPTNDYRWYKDGINKNIDTKNKKGTLILGQIEDKKSLYKMIVMFLRYFNLFSKLNRINQKLNGKNALIILAEYGEKLFAMHLLFVMFSELSLPIVDKAIKNLSIQIKNENNLTENGLLTPRDYFSKEITSFQELIPAVMTAQKGEIDSRSNIKRDKIYNEVATTFSVVIEALTFYKSESWTIHIKSDEQNWTNNSQLLYHFNKEFNLIFDLIEEGKVTAEFKDCLLKNLQLISGFILSQQSKFQRNNSSIIQRFYKNGKIDISIRLAEEYHDFATLIRHCHDTMSDIERRCRLEEYKQQYKDENFDLYLYQFYKERGLITELLEQEGDRADEFLSKHDEIGWIRHVDRNEYTKAKETLQSIAYSAAKADKKKTALSLAKLAALCEDEVNLEDVAQITNNLLLLEHQEQISPAVMKVVNPDNLPMSIEEIVNANISEKLTDSYLKALLALTTAIESREGKTDVGTTTVEKLKNRIWASLPTADEWKRLSQIDTEEECIKFIQQTILAETIERLQLANIPADLKLKLLPESNMTIKNGFPLKGNSTAKQIFDKFIDDSMDIVHRSIESEVENIQMVF